ncbi:hypothetical protein GCM10009122_42370 [Fulvivirga kasyanovii]
MDNYLTELKETLKILNRQQKLVFAFWISKRLFSNYAFFHKETSFGDIDVLLDGLSLIDRYLFIDSTFVKDEVIKCIAQIDENTPDTNDYSQITVSFALDACVALTESLSYILDNNDQRIVNVASCARDTVDMFVQEKEELNYDDSEFEFKIQNDEFMKNEIRAQRDFFSRIKASDFTSLRSNITFDEIIKLDLLI